MNESSFTNLSENIHLIQNIKKCIIEQNKQVTTFYFHKNYQETVVINNNICSLNYVFKYVLT